MSKYTQEEINTMISSLEWHRVNSYHAYEQFILTMVMSTGTTLQQVINGISKLKKG